MHIKRYIILSGLAFLCMLAFTALTPPVAFADTTPDGTQVVSSFIPLGGSQVVNGPYGTSIPSNGGYSPYGGYDNSPYTGYNNPYGEDGNPYDASGYGNPYGTSQGNNGHYYGGNGLPFSGYSNSGTSPLHVQ